MGPVDCLSAETHRRSPTSTEIYALERRSLERVEALLPARAPAMDRDRGKQRLLCRACAHFVTDVACRILRDGAHNHTFTNPLGVVFEIGCFATAPGCAEVGAASAEHSWFAGFAWRVALCGHCSAHLGWRFTSNGDDEFYGLILDRLVQAQ